jgi:hypothetical protein
MLGTGLKQPAVCAVLDISENTLRKHYPREIESAEFEVHAMVGQSLIFNAIGGPDKEWQKANMSAAIFYAKTRMGWKAFSSLTSQRGERVLIDDPHSTDSVESVPSRIGGLLMIRVLRLHRLSQAAYVGAA